MPDKASPTAQVFSDIADIIEDIREGRMAIMDKEIRSGSLTQRVQDDVVR